jgi:hypothetical protein
MLITTLRMLPVVFGVAGWTMVSSMTATSPSATTESASSTPDPDVNRPSTAEELPAEFDEDLDDDTLYAEYRRLAAEQDALRRLATLVAGGVEPCEVFNAVADEMRQSAGGECAGLYRYEITGEITLMAVAHHAAAAPVQWPVGTRTPIAGNTLASTVLHTGGPARVDSYDVEAGVVAAQVRAVGVRAAVGVPIIVDGRVWGVATVGSAHPGPMPADTEMRITRFAELAATALVAGYRDE